MAATCLNGGQILETQDGVTMFYLYFLGWFGCNLPLILEIMERRQSEISNKYLFTLKTLEIERYTLFKLVLVVVMKIPSKTIAFIALLPSSLIVGSTSKHQKVLIVTHFKNN